MVERTHATIAIVIAIENKEQSLLCTNNTNDNDLIQATSLIY